MAKLSVDAPTCALCGTRHWTYESHIMGAPQLRQATALVDEARQETAVTQAALRVCNACNKPFNNRGSVCNACRQRAYRERR